MFIGNNTVGGNTYGLRPCARTRLLRGPVLLVVELQIDSTSKPLMMPRTGSRLGGIPYACSRAESFGNTRVTARSQRI
jgi:hypothetical protein